MKHIRNVGGIFLLFVLMLAITYNCSLGVKKSFLLTQKTFNDMVTNYLVYYEAASPDEQKDLKENVHPKILEALDLLTGFNEAIRLGIDPSKIDQEHFREIRYELYKKLPEIFEKED